MARVAIIILNWNGRRFLEDCLTAVLAQTYPDYEVLLVDNGSDDGSAEWVAERFPSVCLIRNQTNLGFAMGSNQAIRASSSEFIATLNNDTHIEPGWLAELVRVMESDPTVGSCASKILFADRPHVIDSTGICMDPVGIPWDRRGGEVDEESEIEPIEVFGACAAAALYRRAMLDQIGLFDEDFFAYMEDADLAWRARLAGWRCLHVPTARLYHAHSGTAGEGTSFKNRLLGRNKVLMIAKNYPTGRLLLYLPLILLYDLAAVFYTLVFLHDPSSLQGRLAGLARLPRIWHKRKVVQALPRQNRGRPWYRFLSPLESPWQVLRRFRHLQLC